MAEKEEDETKKIGKSLEYYPSRKLGSGSYGTEVFKGKFESREIAVKRVFKEHYVMAEREAELLRCGEFHKHVLHYYTTERLDNYVYIALQLCEATLDDLIHKRYENEAVNPMKIVEHAFIGLNHLHTLKPAIVHRDVKPKNILIGISNSNEGPIGIVSDLGLSKQLVLFHESFSNTSSRGTSGWMAPEILKEIGNGDKIKKFRATLKVDVFANGLLIYYTKSSGKHAFGDNLFERDGNVLNNKYKLTYLDETKDCQDMHLIKRMLRADPEKRPSMKIVLSHPLFWSNNKRLEFFHQSSDVLMNIDEEPLLELEKKFDTIVPSSNWISDLDPIVQNLVKTTKRTKYDGTKLKYLLRAIRNYAQHYHELEKEEKEAFGDLDDGYVGYWLKRFPCLLLGLFQAIQQWNYLPQLKDFYNYRFDNYSFS